MYRVADTKRLDLLTLELDCRNAELGMATRRLQGSSSGVSVVPESARKVTKYTSEICFQ